MRLRSRRSNNPRDMRNILLCLRGSVFPNSIRQTFYVFITFSFFVISFENKLFNPNSRKLKSYTRPFTVKENNLCLKIGNNRIWSHNSSFRSGFSPPPSLHLATRPPSTAFPSPTLIPIFLSKFWGCEEEKKSRKLCK